MRKQSVLLIAAGLLATASCNTETGNAEEAQAKIDSMVNARVDDMRLQLKAENDSIINELAMWRADSIINARKGVKVVKPKPTKRIIDKQQMSDGSGTTEQPASAKPTKPKDGFKASADNNKESGSNKFKSSSDQNQQSGSSKFKSKSDK